MKHITLDRADERIKRFVRTLPLEPDGVGLELDGQVVCKVVSPHDLTSAERDAILQGGWERIRQAQQRNRQVPAKLIEREVRQAVQEVRRRRQS